MLEALPSALTNHVSPRVVGTLADNTLAYATPQYESVVVIQLAVLLQERVLANDGRMSQPDQAAGGSDGARQLPGRKRACPRLRVPASSPLLEDTTRSPFARCPTAIVRRSAARG